MRIGDERSELLGFKLGGVFAGVGYFVLLTRAAEIVNSRGEESVCVQTHVCVCGR